MSRLCEGRSCVITGAGRGIGRAHAEALAHHGARVVVNDVDGDAVEEVLEVVRSAGGEAVGHVGDVSSAEGADGIVRAALDAWDHLDVVVNNAGIARDKMLVNMAEADWDAVVRVHLKSTFLVTQRASQHWRARSKAGEEVDARVINTVSSVGLYGNVGQANYAAAKGGIASFTLVASMELGRYGVTANAVCPTALTDMTASTVLADAEGASDGVYDAKWVSPAVVWLASPASSAVTGRVVVASGKRLAIAEGWSRGPTAPPVADAAEVGDVLEALLADAAPNADVQGDRPTP